MMDVPRSQQNRSDSFKELSYGLTENEDTLIVSGRSPVHYSWQIHLMAFSILLVNVAKVPRAIQEVHHRLSWIIPDEREVTVNDVQAASAGAVIVCLLSACVGALIVYLMQRRQVRAADNLANSSEKNGYRISLWQLIMVTALTLPDLWYVVTGSAPYLSWQFLLFFALSIGVLTLWRGQGGDLLATVPAAVLLGVLL